MAKLIKTKVHYAATLQERPWQTGPSLWVCDQRVLRSFPDFRSWIEQRKGIVYSVRAGEELKSIESFPQHIEKIQMRISRLAEGQIHIVALGGGTVGDFAGFVASTFRRGVPFVQVPTTWLAALDSAHGGKNGLNVGGYKNQIGTIYLPKEVLIVQSLLERQPPRLAEQAMGELFKMVLIQGESLWSEIKRDKHSLGPSQILWKHLKKCISAKYEVVEQDLYEKSGLRQVLNLGHTMGHVWESQLGWSHGESVLQGIFFSLHWSHHLGILRPEDYREILFLMEGQLELRDRGGRPKEQKKFRLRETVLMKGLRADKKRSASNKIRFLFVRAPGEVFAQVVTMEQLVHEAKRQGWLE